MNNDKQITNRFLILCIVSSLLVASIATILEQDHKKTQAETIPEPVVVSTPDPEPVEDPVSVTEPEQESSNEDNDTGLPHQVHFISGWDKCLDVLGVDCDVAFLGDSITYKSWFNVYYPYLKICNLAVCSDTIKGINYRMGTLETVKPEKVFLMIGINSLRNGKLDECVKDYDTLLENIRSKGDFELYVMSITPIAKNESGVDDPAPDLIVAFNEKIAELAKQYGATYLDLYSQLVDSGYIRPEYTTDGLHLSDEAYEVWADFMQPYLQ